MLILRPAGLRPSEITPHGVYMRRRQLIKSAGLAGLAAAVGIFPGASHSQGKKLTGFGRSGYSTLEKPTAYSDAVNYNNYYEFGTDKSDPASHAHKLKTQPWTVVVEGAVRRPKTFGIDELLRFPLEERVYRMRCVEGWSMVIPWIGFEFRKLASQVEPTAGAKFVEFVTAYQPENMPGVRMPVLEWPYVEALRIDEAMHPLTVLAVGVYDEILPRQNGAPVRLVVPWKYGFKSGKSIVRIRFVEIQPRTAWEKAAPHEYGFYSNVNPDVDHPRWSQSTERRIGEDGLFSRKRKTLAFNGYAEQVAGLYAGMDLKKFF